MRSSPRSRTRGPSFPRLPPPLAVQSRAHRRAGGSEGRLGAVPGAGGSVPGALVPGSRRRGRGRGAEPLPALPTAGSEPFYRGAAAAIGSRRRTGFQPLVPLCGASLCPQTFPAPLDSQLRLPARPQPPRSDTAEPGSGPSAFWPRVQLFPTVMSFLSLSPVSCVCRSASLQPLDTALGSPRVALAHPGKGSCGTPKDPSHPSSVCKSHISHTCTSTHCLHRKDLIRQQQDGRIPVLPTPHAPEGQN